MANERRKSTRFQINQFVDVSFGREQFFHASGINISENGMLCEVSGDIGHSRDVYMLLQLPDGGALELNGMIVRIDKKGKQHEVAVEFVELYPEDKKLIKKFINFLEKK